MNSLIIEQRIIEEYCCSSEREDVAESCPAYNDMDIQVQSADPTPQQAHDSGNVDRSDAGFGASGLGFNGRPIASQSGDGERDAKSTPEWEGSGEPPATPSNTPPAPGGRRILEKCRALDGSMDDLESRLQALSSLHRRVLHDEAPIFQVDKENINIMAIYRELGRQLKYVKSQPDASQPSNAPQVGRLDRRLKDAIQKYHGLESEFRKQIQEQQARQYRIVYPNAPEEEVQAAVEDGGGQIFQQALLTRDRTGNARSTLGVVRARHDEVQRIEQTMIELAQLFHDLDQIVVEQEPLVTKIEQEGKEVMENVIAANGQLGKGITKARAARRKKWICFWICILSTVILALVGGIYLGVIRPQQSK